MDVSKSADEGEIGAGGVMAAADEALLKMGRHLEQTGIAIEMADTTPVRYFHCRPSWALPP